MRVFLVAVGALLLPGCVTTNPPATQTMQLSQTVPAGRYADYRALVTEQTSHMGFEGPSKIPENLQQETRICLVNLVMANLTPAEMARFDSYARGEIPISEQELSSVGDVVLKRADPSGTALVANMHALCPSTIDQLQSISPSGFHLTYIP